MANNAGQKLGEIFERRRVAAIALCLNYAGLILAEFRKRQVNNEFWENRTNVAMDTVFSDGFVEENEIGFFIAHQVEYGVYLELANDRAHEALRPLIEEFYPKFKRDLALIYGVAA